MIYINLSKAALWFASITLLGTIVSGTVVYLSQHDTGVLLPLVQACQALSVIAITVLGYHGYKALNTK